MLSLIIL